MFDNNLEEYREREISLALSLTQVRTSLIRVRGVIISADRYKLLERETVFPVFSEVTSRVKPARK